jgi:hypothetical protein
VVPTLIDEMLNSAHPEKTQRAMAEMFKMVKFDIEKLKRTYDGK